MKKKVYIHVNVFENIRNELKNEAKEKGMPLNSYINLIISERKK